MASDRREFLKALGGLTAVAAAGTACEVVPADAGVEAGVAAPPDGAEEADAALRGGRSYAPSKFALELDDGFAAWLATAEGGTAVAEVVTEKLGPDNVQKKHISTLKYEDITISFGRASKACLEWIASSVDRRTSRKNGAIVETDWDLRERSRLEFFNAMISEIGLPALDASSKETGRISLKFAPEYTRSKKGSGAVLKFDAGSKEHKWSPASFRLEIDGIEDAARVTKIDALTIKQKFSEDPVGGNRDYERQPASLEFPNLTVHVSERNAEGFYAWHEDFVIRGNCADEDEKGGTLEVTDRDGAPVFSVRFHHLGVFRVARAGGDPTRDAVRRVKAEMYCERIQLQFAFV